VIHPDTELRYIDSHIGYGVFATRPIPRGTITWVLDDLDRRLTTAEILTFPVHARALAERYSYRSGTGEHILCWDHGKYVNHGCEPNCLSPGWEIDIAVRDITADEELTTDYGSLNLERPLRCGCRSPACRGTINPDDFEARAEQWDDLVRQALQDAHRVPQPLWGWLPNPEEIASAATTPTGAPSILRNRRREPIPW
jgi:hypothetical protein